MDTQSGTLTVFFEDPFWVGVFERESEEGLSACRIVFGAEPKDAEVWDYILNHYHELSFSPAVAVEERHRADSPKRRQRSAGKRLQESGVGTKSQQALKMQVEKAKLQRRLRKRERKEAEDLLRFERKQQKRKEKHRGH